jgi:hypothetical protein
MSYPTGPARACAVAVALTLGGLGLTGCSIISKVNHAVNAINANKQAIDALAGKLKNGKAVPFAATYVTMGGGSTGTVTYAVNPPTDVAFKETPGANANGNPSVDLIINASGEFSCSSTSSNGSGPWMCNKVGGAAAAARNQVFNFYTPSHWIVFLQALAVTAGLAGEKVSNTTMTVNGISLNCVKFNDPNGKGSGTICSTSAGILGYVKVSTSPAVFEIKSFTSSPSPSLFQLPAGAKVH